MFTYFFNMVLFKILSCIFNTTSSMKVLVFNKENCLNLNFHLLLSLSFFYQQTEHNKNVQKKIHTQVSSIPSNTNRINANNWPILTLLGILQCSRRFHVCLSSIFESSVVESIFYELMPPYIDKKYSIGGHIQSYEQKFYHLRCSVVLTFSTTLNK